MGLTEGRRKDAVRRAEEATTGWVLAGVSDVVTLIAEEAAVTFPGGLLADAALFANAREDILDYEAALAEAERELERRGQAISDAMGRYRGHEPLIEAVGRLSDRYWDAESRIRELEEENGRLQRVANAAKRYVNYFEDDDYKELQIALSLLSGGDEK